MTRTCLYCGKQYAIKHYTQKFCSGGECKSKYHYQKRRERQAVLKRDGMLHKIRQWFTNAA